MTHSMIIAPSSTHGGPVKSKLTERFAVRGQNVIDILYKSNEEQSNTAGKFRKYIGRSGL